MIWVIDGHSGLDSMEEGGEVLKAIGRDLQVQDQGGMDKEGLQIRAEEVGAFAYSISPINVLERDGTPSEREKGVIPGSANEKTSLQRVDVEEPSNVQGKLWDGKGIGGR